MIDGPRETGDGYYEATVLDPEGNRVELVASDYSDDVALRPAFYGHGRPTSLPTWRPEAMSSCAWAMSARG